uniref:Uncharacterized protein n=1 Tax=Nelumbo nucifera TaxID=4432 RepID=A0A822YIG5_NELNU|nr:TPA_asm: hypothetical protein HUJ06_004624 [Nelumbo nucifera]
MNRSKTLERETKPRVLVNTFDALEPEALRVVEEIDLIGVGPLIPSAFLDGKDPSDKSFGGDLFHGSTDYMEWLNSKEDSSVGLRIVRKHRCVTHAAANGRACKRVDREWPAVLVGHPEE